MLGLNNYMWKVGLAKWLGFAYGLVWFFLLPIAVPEAAPLVRWGMLGWAITMGGMVGMAVLALPRFGAPFNRMPEWFVAGAIGAWMGVLVVLFQHDMVASFMAAYLPGWMVFPWLLIIETALLGAIMGWASKHAFGKAA